MSEPSQRERVFTAADALFEELGRASLPTVADVRKRACVDSNAATRLLREWRQERRKEISDPAEEAPEELQASISAAMRSTWRSARRMSRQEFDATRADWEAERKHIIGMLAEVSASYDEKVAELRVVEGQMAALQAAIEGKEAQVIDLRERVAAATEQATSAKQQVLEIEKRVDLLVAERDRTYDELGRARARHAEEVAALRATANDDRARMSAELVELKERSEVLRQEGVAALQEREAAKAEAVTFRDLLAAEQKRLASVVDDLISSRSTAKSKSGHAKRMPARAEQANRAGEVPCTEPLFELGRDQD